MYILKKYEISPHRFASVEMTRGKFAFGRNDEGDKYLVNLVNPV